MDFPKRIGLFYTTGIGVIMRKNKLVLPTFRITLSVMMLLVLFCCKIFASSLFLEENFDMNPSDPNNPNKWQVVSSAPVTIANNEMHILLDSNNSLYTIITPNTSEGNFKNFIAQMEFKMDKDDGLSYYGFCIRDDNAGNYYRIVYSQYSTSRGINILKYSGGTIVDRGTLYSISNLSVNVYHKLKVEVIDNHFFAYIDDVLAVSYDDNNATILPGQRISIKAYDQPGWFKNITIRSYDGIFFKAGSKEISSLSKANPGDKISAEIYIPGAFAVDRKCAFILMAYKDGLPVKIMGVSGVAPANTMKSLKLTFDTLPGESLTGYTFEAMLWDGYSEMNALSDTYLLN